MSMQPLDLARRHLRRQGAPGTERSGSAGGSPAGRDHPPLLRRRPAAHAENCSGPSPDRVITDRVCTFVGNRVRQFVFDERDAERSDAHQEEVAWLDVSMYDGGARKSRSSRPAAVVAKFQQVARLRRVVRGIVSHILALNVADARASDRAQHRIDAARPGLVGHINEAARRSEAAMPSVGTRSTTAGVQAQRLDGTRGRCSAVSSLSRHQKPRSTPSASLSARCRAPRTERPGYRTGIGSTRSSRERLLLASSQSARWPGRPAT